VPAKRVVHVESEGSSIWWGLGGVAIGAIAGILIAEVMSGRRLSRGTLLRRVRQIARLAGAKWEPLLGAAVTLRDAWVERRAGRVDESELEADEELDEELDSEASAMLDEADADGDEEEDAFDDEDEEDADDDEDEDEDDDEDEDEDDDEDDEELDDDLEEELEDGPGAEIGRRVLEAFKNDPVLAERAIEIDADVSGHVVLFGDVRTSREVAHAVTIAGGVPGVTMVRQRLSVRLRR
jgi:hypothetical protein